VQNTSQATTLLLATWKELAKEWSTKTSFSCKNEKQKQNCD
jgi:hypothetical protein